MTHVSNIRPARLARAGVAASAVAVLLGLAVALSLSLPSSSPARVASEPALDGRDANAAAQPTATMRIVPAPVIDQGADLFVGAGDGSNGSWVGP